MGAPRTAPVIGPGTGRWENEGGSLAPDGLPFLPDEVVAIRLVYYRVGPYNYTNLGDAMAQYRRQQKRAP